MVNRGVNYKDLYTKYDGFGIAQLSVLLNGEPIGGRRSGKTPVYPGDVTIELSSGFEASVVHLRLFGAYNRHDGAFDFKDVEKQAVLGVSMAVSLGYMDNLETVFVGFVAGVRFGYDGIDPPYIELVGMDAKGIMMSSSYATQITAASYGKAVEEVLKRRPYVQMQNAKIITDIKIDRTPDTPAQQNNKATDITIEMVSESDYEFIVKAARKFNFEFFIDRGVLLFRKARGNMGPLMTLKPNEGIIHFAIEYSLTGIVQNIEARSMDAGQGKIISARVRYNNKLSPGNRAAALIRDSARVFVDPTIRTQEDADTRAQAMLDHMSYKLGYMECECIGIPELVPGRFVEIQVGSPSDNRFYITHVTHTLNNNGEYRTKLTGCINESR